MQQQMTKEVRDQIIEEDFGFLKEITIHEVDGKLMMGDSKLPFNVGHIFYEKEFIRDWLMAFALGNNHGVNYFNADAWLSFTDKGAMYVMVVDDDHKPLLVIPPMISSNMTPKDYAILRAASYQMQSVAADTFRKNDPNANLTLANHLKKHFDSIKRVTLTEMVNAEFYAKHGIIPEVEQQVYYIKDNINNGKAPIADITKSRDILYRNYRDEPVTEEEQAFINQLAKGEFTFKNPPQKKKVVEKVAAEKPVDPFEC